MRSCRRATPETLAVGEGVELARLSNARRALLVVKLADGRIGWVTANTDPSGRVLAESGRHRFGRLTEASRKSSSSRLPSCRGVHRRQRENLNGELGDLVRRELDAAEPGRKLALRHTGKRSRVRSLDGIDVGRARDSPARRRSAGPLGHGAMCRARNSFRRATMILWLPFHLLRAFSSWMTQTTHASCTPSISRCGDMT